MYNFVTNEGNIFSKKSIYELKRAFSCVVTKDLKPHLKYAYDGLFL